jgi:hypothetical protein
MDHNRDMLHTMLHKMLHILPIFGGVWMLGLFDVRFRRVQYVIEGLFETRRKKFSDHPMAAWMKSL